MNWKTIVIIVLSLMVVETSYATVEKKKKKITVSGYVMDVNEKPLEGISIIVDNVHSKKFTDRKGFYKIKIKPETKTLIAYDLNHGGIKMDYAGNSEINFVLMADSTNPNYISPEEGKKYNYVLINKKNSTSGMGVIDANDLENNAYTNIYQMIKGKVPGVTVVGSTIIIRGKSSIKMQSQPLFIVNGVETSTIDYLNPRDVKSISVLKPSSAGIYGSKGSMGVIIITLKGGLDK